MECERPIGALQAHVNRFERLTYLLKTRVRMDMSRNNEDRVAPRDGPWLYAELHEKKNLDDVIRTIFRLPQLPNVGDAPAANVLDLTSRDLMGYLFIHVHQSERFLKLHGRNAIPPGLAAWDLGEEAVHELLVGYLLARLGAVPQGIPHMRRALELIVEGIFLSVSYLETSGEAWNPFSVLYLSDMWQLYAARRPIRAREVIESLHKENRDIPETFRAFSEYYVDRFVSKYCDRHLLELENERKAEGFTGLLSDSLPPTEQTVCSRGGCKSSATKRVLDRVPDFDLMREVVKAKLAESGYSTGDDNLLKQIHSRTSGFVHVTREGHEHGPEWEEGEVRTYTKIVHDLLAWMARTLSLLWEYHEADLPGIRPVLEDWRYDFASQRWEDDVVKLRICNLFLAAERGK